MAMRLFFVSFFATAALVACGSNPTNPDALEGQEAFSGQGDAGAGYNPCAGKVCGQACSLCGPNDPGCVETAVPKQCTAAGHCSVRTPTCGGPQDAGRPYDPCAGKACGQACSLCAPNEPGCVETALPKQCSAAGQCTALAPTCGPQDAGRPYDPCAGKACGQACRTCPPNDPSCFESLIPKQCTAAGHCSPLPAVCGGDAQDSGYSRYEPCRGKRPGDTCTLCTPNDPGCVETAVVKVCQADGACR